MAKITIIEGNSNDKDNVRAYMVKGEKGATIASITKTSTEGLVDTYTINMDDGRTQTFTVSNGFSPTANVTKVGTVSTLTVTDAQGTTTTTINDGLVNVIDTFNTSENKHTNAPSLNAVEERIGTVQTATITVTKSDIDFTLRFKRNMNIVMLNVEMFIPTTVTSVSNWLTYQDFTMPEWAKTSDNEVINLDNQLLSAGTSAGADYVAFSGLGGITLSRANSNDYRLVYFYNQAQNASYPSGQTLIGNLKYIVID